MQNPSEKPCDICGDIGMAEVLVTCSKCNNSRQHIYCMHPNLCKLPVSWFCQPYNLCRKVSVEGAGKGSLKISDVHTKVKVVEELGMASPEITDAFTKVKVEELEMGSFKGMESTKISDVRTKVKVEELGTVLPKISDAFRKVKVEELGMESLKVSDATETVGSPSSQPGKAMLAIEGGTCAISLITKQSSVLTEKKPIVTSPMQISSVVHKPDAPATTFSNSIKMEEGDSSIKEQDLQIASNGGECILGAQPAIGCAKDLKEQEDEDELTCMVCKKGYYSKPNDTLGVYSYSKLVKLDPIKKRGVYTTISNFNIIHFQCHQICKQAGNPKKEWKGALIRNHGGLCNSIFPIKSPSVSTLQYVQCVSEYWGNLKRVGRGGGSRLQLLSYDLLLMLGRFSTMKSLKCEETEKDTRLIPFMIQMGRYLVEQESSPQRRIKPKAITSCLQSCSTQPNQLQLLMVTSLLVLSYESWLTLRPTFLECGIELAYMQHKNKQPLFSEPVAASEKICINPILVYIGLIEQLQRFFKLDTTSKNVSWEVIMTEKLNNIKELLDFSKKLLVWLEEMTLARKLSRVFEIMDVSSDLDFGKFSKYEEFAEFLKDVIPSVTKGKKRKRKGKKDMQVV